MSWIVLAMATSFIEAKIYHLAMDGDDAADGSQDHPWASLQAAAGRLEPGDRLLARGGVYSLDRPAEVEAEGSAEAWITIAAYPGEEVVFDGASYIPGRGEHGIGLIEVNGSRFLRLENLGVRNSHGMGFHIVHPSRDIEIRGCRSDNTYGPGIGVWGIPREVIPIERVRVIGNEVTRANLVSMELYAGPSEPPHEAISIAGVHDFEVAYNHVHHCGKEGIDVKEYSARGRVHHNHVHDVARQGLYVDAWFGPLEDVTFDHNRVHRNEWGMGISCEGPNSSLRNIYIHHNVFSHHRASGVYFTLWGGDRFRERIYVYNNTFVDNGSLDHWSGPTGNIDLRSSSVERVAILNNLCVGGAAFEIASFIEPGEFEAVAEEKEILIARNLQWRPKDRTDAAAYPEGYGCNHVTQGREPIVVDPQLQELALGVYKPAPGSVAWEAGLAEAPSGLELPQVSVHLGALGPDEGAEALE